MHQHIDAAFFNGVVWVTDIHDWCRYTEGLHKAVDDPKKSKPKRPEEQLLDQLLIKGRN